MKATRPCEVLQPLAPRRRQDSMNRSGLVRARENAPVQKERKPKLDQWGSDLSFRSQRFDSSREWGRMSTHELRSSPMECDDAHVGVASGYRESSVRRRMSEMPKEKAALNHSGKEQMQEGRP